MTVDEARALAEEYLDAHDLLSWCGVRVASVGRGSSELTVPATDRLSNPEPFGAGYVHGGVLSMLAEVAGGVALSTLFEDPEQADVVTTNLDLTFVRPATDDVHASAEVVRGGGTVGVVEVTVETGPPQSGRQVVATGTVTFRLFRETAG